MVGLELPLLAMEHMYLLTEEMPEVLEFNARTGRELVGVIDFKGEIYTRQERTGILLGTYEKACKPWSPVNTPWDFGHELLAPDLDRIAPSLEVGFRISRRWKTPASSRSSTAPSPSRLTATRWSGPSLG
jgi:dimethylglycine dehydrogenase